jgi:hypothetical protein
MDPQLIQRTRYILRTRVRRAQSCPEVLFSSACQHLVEWLDHHPVFSALIRALERQTGDAVEQMKKITSDLDTEPHGGYDPGFYSAKTTEEHAAVCWLIVRAAARTVPMSEMHRHFNLRTLSEYLTGEDLLEIDKAVESIRDVAVDGLYEYLDEKLDTRNIIYGILLKYKQRSEWFHRSRLRQVADSGLENKKGERALAVDLQEYVFDQQVEFVIEPASSSGEADLLLRDPEGRYLLLDAKYIPGNASRSATVERIAAGFHQVYRYCEDYNEPEGFLVVFQRSSLRVTPDLEEADGLKYFKLGGRVIYYLAVHISDEPTASKSGKAEDIFIPREELVKSASA